MIFKAALAILIIEFMVMHFLIKKYFGRSSNITIEEFIFMASLEDIIKMRHHSVSGFLALCVATMARMFDG